MVQFRATTPDDMFGKGRFPQESTDEPRVRTVEHQVLDVEIAAGVTIGAIVNDIDGGPIFVIAGGVDFARVTLADMEVIVAEMRRRAKVAKP